MANESTQDFKSALKYEKSCQPRADLFYKNRYGDQPGMRIWRPDWEEHQGLQKADIDVVIQSGGNNGWTDELKISEKFRTQPWDDVLIEVYEDLDKERPGWAEHTAADWHFYFHSHKWKAVKKVSIGTPTQIEEEEHDDSFVRMVPTWAVRRMYEFAKIMFTETFKDMRANNVNHREILIEDETITLLLVPTKVNGKVAYVGSCACIPMSLFKTMFNYEIETLKY